MLKAKTYFKKNVQGIKMPNILLKELKLIAKNKGIKGYKSISKDKLLSMFNTPELIKKQNPSKT